MELWNTFLNWCESLITDISGVSKFLNFSVSIGGFDINLFALLTISGLLTYLTVAIIKWAVS